MKRIETGDSMNGYHWLAALAIFGLLTAGCTGTPGKNSGALTKSADANEALSMFDGYLERSSQDWYVNGSFCGAGTCRQQLIAADGDAITVTLTQYASISDAQNSFNSVKKGLEQYSVSDENIADSGYVWHRGNIGESGFRSGQLIGVVDYQFSQGNATGNESSNLANILAQILVS